MTYITIGLIDGNLPPFNKNLFGCFTNSTAWEAFGDFLDEILSERADILDCIKGEQWIYNKTYSFQDLSGDDFNWAVRKIRDYIKSNAICDEWVDWGIAVWKDIVEPLIIKDHRYRDNSIPV